MVLKLKKKGIVASFLLVVLLLASQSVLAGPELEVLDSSGTSLQTEGYIYITTEDNNIENILSLIKAVGTESDVAKVGNKGDSDILYIKNAYLNGYVDFTAILAGKIHVGSINANGENGLIEIYTDSYYQDKDIPVEQKYLYSEIVVSGDMDLKNNVTVKTINGAKIKAANIYADGGKAISRDIDDEKKANIDIWVAWYTNQGIPSAGMLEVDGTLSILNDVDLNVKDRSILTANKFIANGEISKVDVVVDESEFIIADSIELYNNVSLIVNKNQQHYIEAPLRAKSLIADAKAENINIEFYDDSGLYIEDTIELYNNVSLSFSDYGGGTYNVKDLIADGKSGTVKINMGLWSNSFALSGKMSLAKVSVTLASGSYLSAPNIYLNGDVEFKYSNDAGLTIDQGNVLSVAGERNAITGKFINSGTLISRIGSGEGSGSLHVSKDVRILDGSKVFGYFEVEKEIEDKILIISTDVDPYLGDVTLRALGKMVYAIIEIEKSLDKNIYLVVKSLGISAINRLNLSYNQTQVSSNLTEVAADGHLKSGSTLEKVILGLIEFAEKENTSLVLNGLDQLGGSIHTTSVNMGLRAPWEYAFMNSQKFDLNFTATSEIRTIKSEEDVNDYQKSVTTGVIMNVHKEISDIVSLGLSAHIGFGDLRGAYGRNKSLEVAGGIFADFSWNAINAKVWTGYSFNIISSTRDIVIPDILSIKNILASYNVNKVSLAAELIYDKSNDNLGLMPVLAADYTLAFHNGFKENLYNDLSLEVLPAKHDALNVKIGFKYAFNIENIDINLGAYYRRSISNTFIENNMKFSEQEEVFNIRGTEIGKDAFVVSGGLDYKFQGNIFSLMYSGEFIKSSVSNSISLNLSISF